MNRFFKLCSKVLAALFLSVFAILMTAILLLPTNPGVRLSLHLASQYAEIDYSELTGSLYGKLSIAALNINTESAKIELSDIELDISTLALFDFSIVIEALDIASVKLALKPTPPIPSTREKNYISVQYPIRLHKFTLGNFQLIQENSNQIIADQLLLSDFLLHKQKLSVSNIALSTLSLFKPGSTENSIDQSNQWPENLLDKLAKPPEFIVPDIFLPLDISVDQLTLGELNTKSADNEDRVILANSALNLYLIDQTATIIFSSYFNAMLTGTDVELEGKIDLSNNFAHDLTGRFRHNQQALDAKIKGNLRALTVDIFEQSSIITLGLNTDLESRALPIELRAAAKSLDKIHKFLGLSESKLSFDTASLNVSGDWQKGYSLSSETSMFYQEDDAKVEPLNAQAKVLIHPQNLDLNVDRLSIKTEAGDFEFIGETRINKVTGYVVANDYDIQLSNFSANVLQKSLPETLNGHIKLINQMSADAMSGQVTCNDIEGLSYGIEITLICDLGLTDNGRLTLNELLLAIGDNQLLINGNILLPDSALWQFNRDWINAIQSKLNISVEAKKLDQLQQGIEGSFSLKASIEGDIQAPIIRAEGAATNLSYNQVSAQLAGINMGIDGTDNWDSSLLLVSEKITYADHTIDDVVLTLEGDQLSHLVRLDINAKDWSSTQSFQGTIDSFSEPSWQAEWVLGEVAYKEYILSKDKQTQIKIDPVKKHYRISEHCWQETIAKINICAADTSWVTDNADVDLRIQADTAVVLHEFLPNLINEGGNLPLDTRVTGNYSLADGVNLELEVSNLLQGTLLTTNHEIVVSAIVLKSEIRQDEISSVLFAGTERTGRLTLFSDIKRVGGQYLHSGRLTIDDADLSLLQRFTPAVNRLQGIVNTSVSYQGDLANPEVFGEMLISDGALLLDAYVYPLTEFNQKIIFDGQKANTLGSFKLGDGSANFDAQLSAGNGFSATGKINGDGLEFAYQTYDINLSPDIEFLVSPDLIDIKGDLLIQDTTIKIESLPESVRSPSPDVILIGREIERPSFAIGLDIDVNILVDPLERGTMQVDALGLNASLSGDLALQVIQERRSDNQGFQPMLTYLNGFLNVLDGSYEAWGQALQIQSGNINFNGVPTLPQFDVSAIRNPLNTQGDVIAGVRVAGNPLLPRLELFSEPPMEQARQLSFLLQGQDIGGGQQGDLNTSLINLLVGFGVGRSENRISQVGRALGFDALNVQTAGQGANTQVQVTGRIADDLQITYAVGVFDAASEVILKYQLLSQLYVEATSGVNNALDLFYEFTRGSVVSQPPASGSGE